MKQLKAFLFLSRLSFLTSTDHSVLQYLREKYKTSPTFQAYVYRIEEIFSYLKS